MAERTRLLRAAALAAIGMLIAACGFCVQQAHADDEVTLYQPDNVTLTKILEADLSITTAGQQFTFHFEPQNGTGTLAADAPVIDDDNNIVLTAGSMGSNSVQNIRVDHFIPPANYFGHAGEWVYLVSETGTTPISGVNTVSSPAQYLMRVYVENGIDSTTGAYTDALVIKGVTVERTVADQHTSYRELKKVDPTVPTDGERSEFVFTNVDSKLSKLEIGKTVSGASADRKLHFNYSMSVMLAPHDRSDTSDQVFTGTISGGDEHEDVVFTVEAGAASSNVATFTLRDGESMVVNLPSGTAYTAVESGTAGYAARAEVTYDDASLVFPLNPTVGSPLTVDDSTVITVSGRNVQANIVSADDTSKVVFTNTRTDITPTGIIISNLPYILLIGVPVVALAVWFVVRRRRSASGQ